MRVGDDLLTNCACVKISVMSDSGDFSTGSVWFKWTEELVMTY